MAAKYWTEAEVRKLFGRCTWPQLTGIVRHLDAIIMERVGTDPARCAGEQQEHDRLAEEQLRRARRAS